VKLASPVVVGVPLIVPLPDSVNPSGKLPLDMLHVIGVSPVTFNVAE